MWACCGVGSDCARARGAVNAVLDMLRRGVRWRPLETVSRVSVRSQTERIPVVWLPVVWRSAARKAGAPHATGSCPPIWLIFGARFARFLISIPSSSLDLQTPYLLYSPDSLCHPSTPMTVVPPIPTPVDAATLMRIVQVRYVPSHVASPLTAHPSHRNALNAALGRQLVPVPSPRSPTVGPPVVSSSWYRRSHRTSPTPRTSPSCPTRACSRCTATTSAGRRARGRAWSAWPWRRRWRP